MVFSILIEHILLDIVSNSTMIIAQVQEEFHNPRVVHNPHHDYYVGRDFYPDPNKPGSRKNSRKNSRKSSQIGSIQEEAIWTFVKDGEFEKVVQEIENGIFFNK